MQEENPIEQTIQKFSDEKTKAQREVLTLPSLNSEKK